jgi:hypothetical protein
LFRFILSLTETSKNSVVVPLLIVFLIIQTKVNAEEVLSSVNSLKENILAVKQDIGDLRQSLGIFLIAQAQKDGEQDKRLDDQEKKLKELSDNEKKQDSEIKKLKEKEKNKEKT